MTDLFVGTWKLDPARSQYDANHRPIEGTMHWRVAPGGGYVMLAEGRNEKGEPVAEAPQTLIPDGKPYPVPGFPGLTTVTTRLQPNVIEGQVRREDGSIAGQGSYVVADDGASMTATTAGFDTQLRRFEMKTVWDRQRG